jgi:hypothetical protein
MNTGKEITGVLENDMWVVTPLQFVVMDLAVLLDVGADVGRGLLKQPGAGDGCR